MGQFENKVAYLPPMHHRSSEGDDEKEDHGVEADHAVEIEVDPSPGSPFCNRKNFAWPPQDDARKNEKYAHQRCVIDDLDPGRARPQAGMQTLNGPHERRLLLGSRGRNHLCGIGIDPVSSPLPTEATLAGWVLSTTHSTNKTIGIRRTCTKGCKLQAESGR